MKNLEVFDVSRTVFTERCTNVTYIVYDENLMYLIKNSQLIVCNNYGKTLHAVLPNLQWTTPLTVLKFANRLWFGTGTQFIHASLFDYSVQYIDPEFTFEAAVWNPTQDAIVIVSSSGKVGLYRVNFEDGQLVTVEESHLDFEVVDEFVTVGWGSADTQFQGGEKADPIKDEAKPMPTDDDKKPRICWRASGDMFAVNYYKEGRRHFKVFKYPCQLVYQAEDIVGLLPFIVWRPQGNKLACVAWTDTKCQVILCERNGVVRDFFDLPRKDKVTDIKWSPCGEALVVCQAHEGKHTLYLFMLRNAIWYLKQTLNFATRLVSFDFLQSPSSTIVIQCTKANEMAQYSFKHVVHSNTSFCFATALSCAVINGCEMYLTFCKTGMAPPPLYDLKAEALSPINFVMFHSTKRRLAIVDANNRLMVFDIKERQLAFGGHYSFTPESDIPLALHHFIWSDEDEIICLAETENGGNETKKFILDVCNKDFRRWIFRIDEGPLVQYAFTELLINNTELRNKLIKVMPASTLHVRLITIHEKLYVFSLTVPGKFYVNDKETLDGVISFIMHEKFLFLTTVNDKLMVIRLREEALEAFCQGNFTNVFIRPVEPGSYLLFGIPESSSVAMQIPRGNVETCMCLILSIDRTESLIQENKWKEAIELARIEKLAAGVIVDLDVNRFLNSIDQFIGSVEAPAVLIDFLFGLQEKNVFVTLYRSSCIDTPIIIDKKVQKISEAMIESLERINYDYYIGVIIVACFIKDSPTSAQEALNHVRTLLARAQNDPRSMEVAEHAIKSVYVLRPTAELYQNALSLYDLNLAVFVARNINMDPKEYEPLINDLRTLDDVTLRYRINDYLKKYGQAARYLVRCFEDLDDLIKYVEDYGVYKDAYEASASQPELHVEMARIYSRRLVAQSLYEEAALVLSKVSLFDMAFENFKKANKWREAIRLMRHLNLSQVESHQHFRDLINGLIKSDRILEASQIYDKHLSDHENAIHLLIENKFFYEAVNLAKDYDRDDIIVSDVRLALLAYCDTLTEKFTQTESTFRNYKTRLDDIRVEKRAKTKASTTTSEVEVFQADPNVEDDAASVAESSSTTSTRSSRTSSSRSSSASSRARRKEERKMQDLKPGGVYEDIALMRAMYDLIYEVFAIGPQVRSICIIGLSLDASVVSKVKALHNLLLHLQTGMEQCVRTIWPPNMNNIHNYDQDHWSVVYDNIPFLDVKYRAPPSNLDTAWAISLLFDD